ncbi:hypothetical protein [Evtepia gabavorous]|uniref:hypothetical protein n=1 Tax=Evtepia gabavorous TaxID=2211183 RepID=UPI00399C2A9C
MKTAVVTDGKYRASLAAVRALGEAGFRVVVTQTRAEATVTPASFVSRFAAETRWIPGSCREADYGTRLRELLEAYDHLFSSVPGRTPSTWSAAGGRSWPGRRTFWWRRSRCWMP